MDALIYTVMSGAERSMRAQQVHANNLANADTAGFRADLELSTAQAVDGPGFGSRHSAVLHANAISGRQGAVRQTGRELDVAIQGDGYFAVQAPGGEAYTRSGSFVVDEQGNLTVGGRPVLGEGGPIVLPPFTRIVIGADGRIQVEAPGEPGLQEVDRLRLVSAEPASLTKSPEGLIVSRDGAPLPVDETVRVVAGHLEGSNVSAVEEMVATMQVTRDFDIQMRMFNTADRLADAANRLVRE